MKIRKFIIIILSALSLIALSVSLSACEIINGIFGEEPSETPPAEERPGDSSDDPGGCAHQYGEWQIDIDECTLRSRMRTCALCGDVDYEYIIPFGHDYGEWHDIVNNCVTHSQERVCKVCKEKDFQYLEAEGHKYGAWTDAVNTCTEHTQTRVCSVCEEEDSRNLTASGHVYGAWVDDVNTCLKHTQKRICAICGGYEVQQLKTSGHKYIDGVCEYCKQSLADGDTSALDKYNGTYGYNYFKTNNLTAQQSLYERIDQSARAFHVSKDTDAEANVQSGKTYYTVSKIDYADLGLNSDEAISVWKTYKDDNPLYYWLSSELTYSKTGGFINILAVEEYAQGAVRAQTNDFVYNKVTEYSLTLDLSDNAYRKALAFHDIIISAVDYAYDNSGQPQSADWAHNIIGVFKEKGAVCEGYAKAFQLLLNYNGVENIFVSGRGNNEEHAWNLVQLDNGKWYWCDLTWDDTPSWEWGISYYYFLVNDTQQVNWRDGGYSAVTVQNFIDSHTPHTAQGTSTQFLYELPARATEIYAEDGLTLRKTFSTPGMTFAVAGYNTVQLVKCQASGAVSFPETVVYGGVTYTVISLGTITPKSEFDSGVVFENTPSSVYIPKTVKFIWDNAMLCSSNTQFTVDSQNEYFCSVDGVLFTKSMKTLIMYPSACANEEYRIPDVTERIARNAFSYIRNLARLYVGKSLVEAGAVSWGVYYDNSRNVVVGEWRGIAYGLKLTGDTRIIVDEENPYFTADGEWLYNKNKTYAYCHFNREAVDIEIPASVTELESYIFLNYFKLESFTVAEGNTAFAVRDGILYNNDFTEVIHIPNKLRSTVN